MSESVFNKVAGLRLQACNLINKRLWHRWFPVDFANILRTPFLQNTSGRLLLLFILTTLATGSIFEVFWLIIYKNICQMVIEYYWNHFVMLSTYKLSTKLFEQTINENKLCTKQVVYTFFYKQPQFFPSAWSCLAFRKNQAQVCFWCCLSFLKKNAQGSQLGAIA